MYLLFELFFENQIKDLKNVIFYVLHDTNLMCTNITICFSSLYLLLLIMNYLYGSSSSSNGIFKRLVLSLKSDELNKLLLLFDSDIEFILPFLLEL